MKTWLILTGILIILLGVVAYGYTSESQNSYVGGLVTTTDSDTPYRNFAIPLFVIGVVLLALGLFWPSKKGNVFEEE